MAYPSFEAAVAASHEALVAMANADPLPSLALWSRRAEAVLANPLGAPKRGFAMIEPEVRRVAAMFAGAAGPLEFEEVSRILTADLGCLIGIERMQARHVGRDGIVQNALRVTTVFQREDDGWRLVLRHADRVVA
ncbi:nuclear transport factor 2 family protein [Sandarakinorhabdus sp. AAP62]|uniref:YybH family protein n=1 Tax=Sandarakinorhabdus sp. AAP62 TaxID=1248916 RepID=UPI0002F59070|nr:nuclear transport factor 2 family protein [Sandarakinorhabdus sp. AAP62]